MSSDASVQVWIDLKEALDSGMENESGDTCREVARWMNKNMIRFLDAIPCELAEELHREYVSVYKKLTGKDLRLCVLSSNT